MLCHLSVPSSPPIDVTVIEGTIPNTINMSWNPPSQLNGKLTGYKIVINHTLENGTLQRREIMTCANHVTVTGIEKHNEYKIKVAASTRKGLGPFSECIEYGGNKSDLNHYILLSYYSRLSLIQAPYFLFSSFSYGLVRIRSKYSF